MESGDTNLRLNGLLATATHFYFNSQSLQTLDFLITNGMKQTEFYSQIVAIIDEKANVQSPEQLAHFLYFFFKQHPEKLKIDRAWVQILKNVKLLLCGSYGWTMPNIHAFFVKLLDLTKYMEKST